MCTKKSATFIYRFLAPCLFLLTVLAFPSCTDPLGYKPQETASLSVALDIASQSRTIVADLGGSIAAYTVTIQNSEHTYGPTTFATGATIFFGDLLPGEYTVTVRAFSDSGATTQIAQGSSTASLVATGTASTTVTLSFTQTGSTGGYSITVQWPVSSGLPYLGVTTDGVFSSTFGTLLAGAVSGTNYIATLSASNVTGGSHTLYLYFKPDASNSTYISPIMETVNIWDGVTSTFWIDSSANLSSIATYGNLPDNSADLAGFSGITVSSLAGSSVFSGSETSYLWSFVADQSFQITAGNSGQSIKYYWNGVAQDWASISGTTYTTGIMDYTNNPSGSHSLTLVVTAADRKTQKTYTFSDQFFSGSASSSDFFAALSANLGGTFYLTTDLTITGTWDTSSVIGDTESTSFSGTFDGNGHTITLPDDASAGLFGYNSGTVKNVTLTSNGTALIWGTTGSTSALVYYNSGTIDGCSTSMAVSGGDNYSGAIAGYNSSTGIIKNCSSTANVTGWNHVGGVAGENNGSVSNCKYIGGTITSTGGPGPAGGIVGTNYGPISLCYSSGTVKGTGNGTYIGGLVGRTAGDSAIISSSYSSASVIGKINCGGLVGFLDTGNVQIINCYARGSVVASYYNAGGLIGAQQVGTMINCYSTGAVTATYNPRGGLVGENTGGTFTNCFFDMSTSGYDNASTGYLIKSWTVGGNTTTTAAMKLLSTFSSLWNISDGSTAAIWGIDATGTINNGYPYLQYFGSGTLTP